MVGGVCMRRILVAITIAILVVILSTTLAFASLGDMSLKALFKSFIRYDFDSVKEVPDKNRDLDTEELSLADDSFITCEPVNVSGGWLYDLAGEGKLYVSVGTLEFNDGAFSERYIDIKGENGEVRLLSNSLSVSSDYTITQFWSYKQQDGNSIIKGSLGEIKCVDFFEMPDGSCRVYGYINGKENEFGELPEEGYYSVKAITEPQNQNPSPSETVHKDGKYTVESKPDYEGYYTKATVVIKNGKIESIDWNIYDSKKRVFDEAYEEVFGNNQHYREQCRKDLSGSKIYGPKLIQVQNIDEVDAISGATWANKKFKEVVKLALEQANVDN